MSGGGLEAVLADHCWTPQVVGPSPCWSVDGDDCGAVFAFGSEHREHVAAVIREHLLSEVAVK